MNPRRPALLLELPRSAYPAVHQLQHQCVAARRSRQLDRDLIIVTEHPPVFTLGRRGCRENLLVSEEELKAKGISVIPVERGGDITFHGPGQIVAYPILDLGAARYGVVELVEALETAMVKTAADWGVRARGNKHQRGAWVEERKLGSVGITIRRGISFHGLALNVNTDLTPFSWVNPCGIPDCAMTSLSLETGRKLSLPKVRRDLTDHLAQLLGLTLSQVSRSAIEQIAGPDVRPSPSASTP